MTSPAALRRVWKAARLYLRFHVDRSGRRTDTPKVWSPRNAVASLHADPRLQETFLEVTSRKAGEDVRIKLRSDHIGLSRDVAEGWQDIEIMDTWLEVRIGDTAIRILPDGAVCHVVNDRVTFIEPDGGVLKVDEFEEAAISADLSELVHRTFDTIAVIDPDGARIGPRKH